MEGHLLMSEKERKRKVVFEGMKEGRVTLRKAARVLGLSRRQCRRSYKRFVEEGDGGLVHRSRGRESNRAKPVEMREAVVRRYRERYGGFGPTLAREKLEGEGYELSVETLRQWLLEARIWKKGRRARGHRAWREPKAHFGELVQLDGSHHRWFGPEECEACLMDMVDDATGYSRALMAQEETTEAAMRVVWGWIEEHGIPQALYTDRKNVFVTDREATLEEQLAGEEPLTAFGGACKKLGIEVITAHSPQAKGRVERKHGVYQDRLVKELGLEGITTIEGANRLLTNGFAAALNAKFAHAPAAEQDFHRPVPPGLSLAEVFCFEQTRTVQNDWTIRHANRRYQVLAGNRPLPKPQDKVVVRRRLDGTMDLLYRGKALTYQAIPVDARVARPDQTPALKPKPHPVRTSCPQRPARTPWRQGCTLMFAQTKTKRGKP